MQHGVHGFAPFRDPRPDVDPERRYKAVGTDRRATKGHLYVAPLGGGSLVTRPLTFSGNRLEINFSTSGAGSVRVEIQDTDGSPIPGFSLNDSIEQIGDELDRTVAWKNGRDLSTLVCCRREASIIL